jgi:transposase
LGVGVESLRQWTVQAQIDAQQAPAPTSTERQRIKDLEREGRDLKDADEILKPSSIFFARELDPRHR